MIYSIAISNTIIPIAILYCMAKCVQLTLVIDNHVQLNSMMHTVETQCAHVMQNLPSKSGRSLHVKCRRSILFGGT